MSQLNEFDIMGKSAFDIASIQEAHPEIALTIQQYIETKDFSHLLFVGNNGCGKGSIAITLAREIYRSDDFNNWRVIYADDPVSKDERKKSKSEAKASLSSGGGVVTSNPFIDQRVKPFLTEKCVGNVSFKLLIIKNFDKLGSEQQAFRRLMEKYSSSCRFILTAQKISNIIDPILSRCQIHFLSPIDESYFRKTIRNIISDPNILKEDMIPYLREISNGNITTAILLAKTSYVRYKIINDRSLQSCMKNHVENIAKIILNNIDRAITPSLINEIQRSVGSHYFTWNELTLAINNELTKSSFLSENRRDDIFLHLADVDANYTSGLDLIYTILFFLCQVNNKTTGVK